MTGLWSSLDAALARTGSTRPLALFRIAIAALCYMRFGPELSLHLAETSFQIVVSLSFFAFVGLMLIGWMARAACAASAGVLAILYLQIGWTEVQPGWTHHHHYMLLIAAVLLSFAPCGRSFSLDAVLARRRAEAAGEAPSEETGPLAVQTLLVLQLCAMYLWTAVDKTTLGFLSGDRLERIFEWTHAGTPLYPLLTAPWFTSSASVAVVILEYVLPVLILTRKRLGVAFAIAFALHGGFYLLLPVQTYSATALAFYLLIARPGDVHAFIDRHILGSSSASGRARSL